MKESIVVDANHEMYVTPELASGCPSEKEAMHLIAKADIKVAKFKDGSDLYIPLEEAIQFNEDPHNSITEDEKTYRKELAKELRKIPEALNQGRWTMPKRLVKLHKKVFPE